MILVTGGLGMIGAHTARALTDAEQYAAVKMRLFRAFDEIPDMMAQGRELRLDATAVDDLLGLLGVS